MTSEPRRPAQSAAPAWWERDGLGRGEGRLGRLGMLGMLGMLLMDGQDVEALARAERQPVFLYSLPRVRANLSRLSSALAARGVRFRIFYAMKSNRYAPLLSALRDTGQCGADVCSPEELLLARRTGFRERDISYTSTVPSDGDLDVIARHPDVWVNCDSLASLARLGKACPGRTIGLRVNPGLGIGYRANRLLQYAGTAPTKFGIYREQFGEALETAARHGLDVRGIHLHCGCGYLTPQLPVFDDILQTAEWFIAQVPGLEHVNVGGGLGIPLVDGDDPLDIDAWSAIVAGRLGGRPFEIWVEPGDYLVKDAGVLVLRVVAVEEKHGVRFAYVDGGWNLHMEPAFYGLPLHIVPCRDDGTRTSEVVTVAGNINEALDIFAAGIALPAVGEGDYLAFLNAGGYGSSMSSNHCLRGSFAEYVLP